MIDIHIDKSMLDLLKPAMDNVNYNGAPDTLTVLPLLAEGSIEEANSKICQVQAYPSGEYGFWDLLELIHAYMLFSASLSNEARAFIEKVFKQELQKDKRICTCNYFLYNTNHPLACIALSIVGAEQFDIPDIAEEAYDRFEDFVEVWEGIGSIPEYNSPVYLAVDFVAFSTIAIHSVNPVVALKAKILQERLWLDTLSRYDRNSWTLAGPHSRAAYIDTIGGLTDVQYYIRKVLGESVPLWTEHLFQTYTAPAYRLHWFGRAAMIAFSVPQYLKDMVFNRRLPYKVTSSTLCGEHAYFNGRRTEGMNHLTTYIDKNFNLGSSMRLFLSGDQNENMIAHWNRKEVVNNHEDMNTLYIRYFINEANPGEDTNFSNQGYMFTFQNKNRAIVVGLPSADTQKLKDVHNLRLELFIDKFENMDNLWIQDHSEVIAIQDGGVYIAIARITYDKLSMRNVDNKLRVALTNYEGVTRDFDVDEWKSMYAGFCMEICNSEDFESFEEFIKYAIDWEINVSRTDKEADIRWDNGLEPMSFKLDTYDRDVLERKLGGKDVEIPMFESPLARQSNSGTISVNNATLTSTEDVTVYLIADSTQHTYVAVNPTSKTTKIILRTELGQLTIAELEFGKVEISLYEGTYELNIEAVHIKGLIQFSPTTGGNVRATINGHDGADYENLIITV
jgi:hypothetical protein